MSGKTPAQIARLTGVPVRTVLRILDFAKPAKKAKPAKPKPMNVLSEKTNAELRELLAEKGVEVPKKANKAQLLALFG